MSELKLDVVPRFYPPFELPPTFPLIRSRGNLDYFLTRVVIFFPSDDAFVSIIPLCDAVMGAWTRSVFLFNRPDVARIKT